MAIKTTTTKKPTKNERYTQITALLTRCAEAGLLTEAERKELTDFVAHEQELLTRKSTSKDGQKKMSARQTENETLRATILTLLSENDEPMTISMLLEVLPKSEDMTHNRVSALLSQLVKGDEVQRTKAGGKTLFAPSTEDEGEGEDEPASEGESAPEDEAEPTSEVGEG